MFSRGVLQRDIKQLHVNNSGVPTFLPQCCSFIKRHSKTEGIFRVNGSKKMEEILSSIFQYRDCCVPPCAQVHDITCFLKTWLRTLPVPLISPDLYNNTYKKNDRASILKLIENLPSANRQILAYILDVLKSVLNDSNSNKMSFSNLDTCFSTCLSQNNKDLKIGFDFAFLYDTLVIYLNNEGSDFQFLD